MPTQHCRERKCTVQQGTLQTKMHSFKCHSQIAGKHTHQCVAMYTECFENTSYHWSEALVGWASDRCQLFLRTPVR